MQYLLSSQYAFSAFIARTPFVRLLLPLLAGIVSDRFLFNDNCIIASVLLCISVFVLVYWQFLSHATQFRYYYMKGIFVSVLLYSLSLFWCYSSHHPNIQNWHGAYKDTAGVAIVSVDDIPEIKDKSVKVPISIQALATSQLTYKVKGRAILYFEKSKKSYNVQCGDILAIPNQWQPIKSNTNPGAFNYKQYCAFKNIYHSAYVKDTAYIQYDRRKNVIVFLKKINEQCRYLLQNYIKDKEAYGIAEAILLGYKGDIADYTLQAYANTGIVHIIAISGLHVGIIFMSLLFLFSLIPFFKSNKKIAMLLVIVLIWLFAFFVGFHASVVRAACMMCMLGIGQVLYRKTSIYNSLFAAAFVMLCYNPMWLWDVGFQLSFMAVLSIVTFYKPIYHLFYSSHILGNKLWQLISVTTAAQILTLPLVLFYFHRFPLQFIISNIVAIPFVTLCLWLGLLLLIFSFVTPVAYILGTVMNYLILKVNDLILFISRVSFFTLENVSISVGQCLLLYFFIFTIIGWIYYKKFIALLSALITLCMILIWQVYVQYQVLNSHQCIIYEMPKNNMMELISGMHYYYDTDSYHTPTAKDFKYILEPAHNALHAKYANDTMVKKSNVTSDIALYAFAQKQILRLKNTRFTFEKPMHVDLLVLDKSCNPDSVWLSKNIVADKIVFTSGIYENKREAIKNKLHHLKNKLHFIDTDGAFVWKF